EKSGLFAEEIFGPSKDWECYCGKYKRIRYKGIICDKCGVEVTRSLVRRERMGHIDLAVPVSHIWFLRGVPSKIGLILDLSVQSLEKVIYFADFIITAVNDDLRQETLKQIDAEFRGKRKSIEADFSRRLNEIKQAEAKDIAAAKTEAEKEKKKKISEQELINNSVNRDEKLRDLQEAVELARKELKELKIRQIISENRYQDLSLKYGHVFEAGIGAETVRRLLEKIDLDKLSAELEEEIRKSSKNQRRRIVRRMKLVKNMKKNNIRPEWMILTVVPVIPPDLRPMVQLDGGRFAASDLNDLYRRVINRNNRLKRLIELNAPEVICRNEKRMLQEAVDALIDNNARHGKTVTASTGQKRTLKSLADMLKGKQGRFRQNLLGKRVDYSGRSVIVVGPHLKLYQCGLPKRMALELFKPFVISQLIKKEYVHNVRSANRFIDSGRSEVWDILEEVTKNSHVLLNRAPTLHRLGIQAFQPILIEGSAIQIHPLVCPPFNADFDGDQMAVHLPLTQNAKKEAKEIMLSSKNLLKPATGEPVITPSQDIVLGCYYLTLLNDRDVSKKVFASSTEAFHAYEAGEIRIQTKIKIRLEGKVIESSIGRILFNEVLPDDMPFRNEVMDKKVLKNVVRGVLDKEGDEETVELLDKIKKLSLHYLTQSGLSWGMEDTPVPPEKNALIQKAEKEIDEVRNQYEMGLLTKEERHARIIDIWASIKNEIQEVSKETLDRFGSVFAMIDSGARGTWGQITQMMGMKGLVTNPAGETIELPVKGSFKEGFDVLEYFISTHGTRKGLSDTALRTANAGYLTRRLVDVAQEVVVSEEDCHDEEGVILTKEESEEIGEPLPSRILGRTVLEDVKSGRKTIIKKGQLVTEKEYELIKDLDLKETRIRSILSCKTIRGICQKCYGYELGYNHLVKIGGAVGIIAAQSIGEPGTQLTMRTFHTGGVAGQDITQGLPRVEELFEARPVKKAAIISEIDGQASISEDNKQKTIKVYAEQPFTNTYRLKEIFENKKYDLKVKHGKLVKKGEVLAESSTKNLKASEAGKVSIADDILEISDVKEEVKEYLVPVGYSPWIKEGELVLRGQQLTEGSINLPELYRLRGKTAVQKYVIKEIQYIYSSQGQRLNDKHIEVIVRQMFSRYYIKDAGDTDLLSGEIVSAAQLQEDN
ncbi:MAG: DNA-directed RNA polymerase subunit beta', partial [Candidatus Kerfeldbacteria bacterium CG_4_10_14_0_8_um_filter_42_10]